MKIFVTLVIALIIFTLTAPIVFFANFLVKRRGHRSKYLNAVLLGLDQFGGSIIYGKVNWTISGYTFYRAAYKSDRWAKSFRLFINAIMLNKQHCYKSYMWDITHTAKEEINNVKI